MDWDAIVTRHEDGIFKAKFTVGYAPQTVFESTAYSNTALSDISLKRIGRTLVILMDLSERESNHTQIFVILRNVHEGQLLKELLAHGSYTNIVQTEYRST